MCGMYRVIYIYMRSSHSDSNLANVIPLYSAICLEAVSRTQTIHELKCRHVFHDVCLERWFLECHFTCPMCHAVFYKDLGGDRDEGEERSVTDIV